MQHAIVSDKEWLEARRRLLARERQITHDLDAVRAERRALPWHAVTKPYVFQSERGPLTLGDLFDGRRQLAVYHFMLTPGGDHVCEGCALLSDHIDAARQHFEHADLSFAAISRVPIEEITAVKKRFGWTFPWVSSHGSTFNYDFGVSFDGDNSASDRTGYNYGTTDYAGPDLPGASIFVRADDGRICHAYSTYARGLELLAGAFNWLDLTPKGRNEGDTTMSWVRPHDEYEDTGGQRKSCCG